MSIHPRIPNNLYYGHLLVATISLWSSFNIRSCTNCWNWMYFGYFWIFANSLIRIMCKGCFKGRKKCCKSNSSTSKRVKSKGSKLSLKNKLRYSTHKIPHCSGCDETPSNCSFQAVYEVIQYFTAVYSLPCVVTQLLINNCVYYRIAIVPILLTLFPLLIFIIDKIRDQSLCDILVIGNIIFLTAFSTAFCNEFGIITAIVYSMVHFLIKCSIDTHSREVAFCLGMAVFCLLSLHTITSCVCKPSLQVLKICKSPVKCI